jgi:hypothetical protein
MRVGLITAAIAVALVAAAPASAATGTYAGTVTNTAGKIALDVKISRAGFVKKITEIRVKDVPSNCETSGPGIGVDHTLPTSLPVRSNGKFEGFFQQPVYNNVSSIAGKIKHKHVRGGFRIDYHYAAEDPYPEEDCDTGPLNFTGKFGAPDETQTPPAAKRAR